MDAISIPIVFNTMRSKSGIYKLSCICDKNIDLSEIAKSGVKGLEMESYVRNKRIEIMLEII